MGDTTFKKVPGEKYLYQYEHQDVHGQWSRKYYAIFVDKKHRKRRTIPLPEKLPRARAELQRLKDLNDNPEYDFDRAKEDKKRATIEAEADITMNAFVQRYFAKVVPARLEIVKDGKVVKRGIRPRTVTNQRSLWKQLEPAFGKLRLSKVAAKIPEYESKRCEEVSPRTNKEVSPRTCFVEMQFLKKMLRLAWDDNLLAKEPRFHIDKAEGGSYRAVMAEEYAAILSAANKPEVRRHIIIQREAGMRPNDPKILTWPMIDFDVGVIRIPGYLLKEKKDRVTPISFELRRCLAEIKREDVRHIDGYVLVRQNGQPIKSIRSSWQNITRDLKLKGCHQHGLRVAAVTDWEDHGIPEPLARRWCGHRRNDVHSVYEKFDEKKQVEWFARAGFTLPPEQRDERHFIMVKRDVETNVETKNEGSSSAA